MIICAAADCTNEVIGKLRGGRKRFCSNRCRYRDAKRKIYTLRAQKGLCLQCGGEMDSPVSMHRGKVSPKYCSKCQAYYHTRYSSSVAGSVGQSER